MSNDNASVAVLPPQNALAEILIAQLISALSPLIAKLGSALRAPAPFMLTKDEAAARCQMSTTTYDKYAKQGLLPTMNATGRVSVEALKRACMKLDGITESVGAVDPGEAALAEWKGRK